MGEKVSQTGGQELRRSISLPLLVLYGLGTMVGAGFYALLGKVAGQAGMLAPLAFVVSALVALASAFAFAELSARYPYSAGEARYVMEGFGRRWLSVLVGLGVIMTGVVSAATIATAFVGFLQDLVPAPATPTIIVLVAGLGLLAAWGILESVWFVNLISVLTVAGLLYVVALSTDALAQLPARWPEFKAELEFSSLAGVLSGGFLGFYAFIGFEDMVNNAEEIKGVERNLPIGIFAALGLTLVLYLAVSLSAVLSVRPERLAEAATPLALVVAEDGGWFSRTGIVLVSLIAGVNGALVQIIMAARVTYGLTRTSRRLGFLGHVNPKTRTPARATALVSLGVLALALFFPMVGLARMTSTIVMGVFAMVNLALVVIKLNDPAPHGPGPRFPIWLPGLGFVVCLAVLGLRVYALVFGLG